MSFESLLKTKSMSRKWLKSSGFLFLILAFDAQSQQLDTLDTFVVEESLTKLESFSSLELPLDSSGFQSLDELVEQSPAYLKNYGQGQLATLSIRGNGASQTQVFWNGFKINSPTLGQSDLALIPSFFFNSATLNFSGASSVNGSGGIGGSIDLANKLIWKKGFSIKYGSQFGSFSSSTSNLGLSFGGDKVFHKLKLLTRKGENDFFYQDISQQSKPEVNQENNALFQFGGQYEIGAKLNKKNLLQGTIFYFNSSREIPPIIGAVSNQEKQLDESIRSFVSWKSFQNKITTDLRISYFKEKLNYADSVSSIFSEVNLDTYQAQFRTKFMWLNSFDVETSIQNSLSVVNSSGFSEKERRNEAGVFLKISEELKKIYYEVFGRQEIVEDVFSPIVFGGGLVYKPFEKGIRFRGNIASNYRVPTLNDLYWAQGGNTNLSPENGWGSELGFDYKWSKSKEDKNRIRKTEWKTSIIGFYNQTDNWIQWVPTNLGYWSPKNIKQIQNKGVEASMKFQLSSKTSSINLSFFYTYTHSRNNSSVDQNEEVNGKTPIYIPTHKASSRISVKKRNFSVVYTQIYNGRVFIDESNSTYLPHYFPANISVNYANKLKKVSYQIGGRVINVFDEPYQVVANRPIPGRNYSIFLTLAL